MCQVHTGPYVSLLALGKTNYTACHPRKTFTYILHVVPITTHTYARQTQVNWTKRNKSIGKKKRRKEKIKETKGKDKKAKKRKRNGKKRKDKKSKKRQDKKRKQGKEKKKKSYHTISIAEPLELTKDGIGLIERYNVTTTQLPPCCLRG